MKRKKTRNCGKGDNYLHSTICNLVLKVLYPYSHQLQLYCKSELSIKWIDKKKFLKMYCMRQFISLTSPHVTLVISLFFFCQKYVVNVNAVFHLIVIFLWHPCPCPSHRSETILSAQFLCKCMCPFLRYFNFC